MIVSPAAENDLRQSRDWYELRRFGLGAEFMLCIEDVFERISRNPELHAIVHRDVRRALARRFPYAIYYRHVGGEIIVLAVIHSRRDPQQWQVRT
ncbi:MAG: type II toxin-antitoxin system RelE/ParE family toxin [Pirellulales bacterium]